MTAARRRAEEALAEWDAVPSRLSEEERTALVHCASALRSLLAEEDERGITETAPLTPEQYRYLASRPDPPAPPAADEVREAAERCRMRVEHAFDPDCPCDQNTNCYAGAIADMDALLSALAARGGA